MMVRKYISVFLFMVTVCFSHAQDLGFSIDGITTESNRIYAKVMGRVWPYDAKTNQYFLFPNDWVSGTLVLTNGDSYEDIKVRLHVKVDELIAYNATHSKLFFVEKDQVKSFTLEEGGYIRQMIKLKGKDGREKEHYFELLYKGNQLLLVFRYIYERKTEPFRDEFGVMQDLEYKMKKNYYRYSKKDGFHKIALKRRALLAEFTDDKRQVKRILRKARVNPNNEQDMIKAFKLLDENGLLN